MFRIIFEHRLLTGLISFFLFSSIVCQIVSGIIYRKMIFESDNMSATENKLLKQCKQKYANYYKLNGKMVNTEVFVDKFLQKISIAGIRLSGLNYIAGQMMMLSVLITGISICLSLAAGNTFFQIIPYYLISILGLYLYFSISGIADVPEKRKALKVNIVDYLENHFVPRLETERENAMEEGIKKREKYARELLAEEFPKKPDGAEEMKHIEDVKPRGKTRLWEDTESQEQKNAGSNQDELEHLLEEFFA